jgi:hypothetical protein
MSDHPKTTRHNYQQTLDALIDTASKEQPDVPEFVADIQHDDWCDVLTSDDPDVFCNCDPVVQLIPLSVVLAANEADDANPTKPEVVH